MERITLELTKQQAEQLAECLDAATQRGVGGIAIAKIALPLMQILSEACLASECTKDECNVG